MTGGTHITPHQCAQMRRDARKSYFYVLIAREYDISTRAVAYHVKGQCSHTAPEGVEAVDRDLTHE